LGGTRLFPVLSLTLGSGDIHIPFLAGVRVFFGATIRRAHAMTDATQRSYKQVEIVVPLLYVAGAIAALLGIASLVAGRFGVMAGLSLLFGGLGALAFAQLFELLNEIACHLAAIRSQMNRGVLGLLG
jgi:hypothetical protein